MPVSGRKKPTSQGPTLADVWSRKRNEKILTLTEDTEPHQARCCNHSTEFPSAGEDMQWRNPAWCQEPFRWVSPRPILPSPNNFTPVYTASNKTLSICGSWMNIYSMNHIIATSFMTANKKETNALQQTICSYLFTISL